MGIKLEIDISEINKITQKLGDIKLKAQDIRAASESIRLIQTFSQLQ
ncbi:MAG: hypothetical protein QNJ60_09765 [Xenococcaceae cyanobacterium MO_188.B19]|nr:hypothetical protein [Xenococcaceae cyanobacterium MO_188.B19]